MLDNDSSLLPKVPRNRPLRAVLIVFEEICLEEMQELLRTLKVEVGSSEVVSLREIAPSTYLTKGKLESLKSKYKKDEYDVFVIDAELSPTQLRNLEKETGISSLDRAGVILEIFSQNARTREAKTQVALARCEYILPRLAHFWSHFERQRGGIGLKGIGEKQLEMDRRLFKDRMAQLRRELDVIQKERAVRRGSRKDLYKVALIGYTNAGKSTLLNSLTSSHVLAENKLFATLDSSVRALSPESHPPIIAIDTVGFISRIPTTLIASFRSTLEEVFEADLLLHVLDASSEFLKEQAEVTQKIILDLGLSDKPTWIILNKIDLMQRPQKMNELKAFFPGSSRCSAIDAKSVEDLRQKILKYFIDKLKRYEVLLPYSAGKLESLVHRYGYVERQEVLEGGLFIRFRMDPVWFQKLGYGAYSLGPDQN